MFERLARLFSKVKTSPVPPPPPGAVPVLDTDQDYEALNLSDIRRAKRSKKDRKLVLAQLVDVYDYFASGLGGGPVRRAFDAMMKRPDQRRGWEAWILDRLMTDMIEGFKVVTTYREADEWIKRAGYRRYEHTGSKVYAPIFGSLADIGKDLPDVSTCRCYQRRCLWFRGISHVYTGRGKWICEGFIQGIPEEIALGKNEHKEQVKGDRGFKFTPLVP